MPGAQDETPLLTGVIAWDKAIDDDTEIASYTVKMVQVSYKDVTVTKTASGENTTVVITGAGDKLIEGKEYSVNGTMRKAVKDDKGVISITFTVATADVKDDYKVSVDEDVRTVVVDLIKDENDYSFKRYYNEKLADNAEGKVIINGTAYDVVYNKDAKPAYQYFVDIPRNEFGSSNENDPTLSVKFYVGAEGSSEEIVLISLLMLPVSSW